MEIKERLAHLLIAFAHYADKRVKVACKTVEEVLSPLTMEQVRSQLTSLVEVSKAELELIPLCKNHKDVYEILPSYGESLVEIPDTYTLTGHPSIAEEVVLTHLSGLLLSISSGQYSFPVEKSELAAVLDAQVRSSQDLAIVLFSLANCDDEQTFISAIDILSDVAEKLSNKVFKWRALFSSADYLREMEGNTKMYALNTPSDAVRKYVEERASPETTKALAGGKVVKMPQTAVKQQQSPEIPISIESMDDMEDMGHEDMDMEDMESIQPAVSGNLVIAKTEGAMSVSLEEIEEM